MGDVRFVRDGGIPLTGGTNTLDSFRLHEQFIASNIVSIYSECIVYTSMTPTVMPTVAFCNSFSSDAMVVGCRYQRRGQPLSCSATCPRALFRMLLQ
jgi:hypothetical protein